MDVRLLRPVGCPLVTGRFRHSRGTLLDLHLEGQTAPLGVTARHPIWSLDRAAWVPAGELEIGERLSGRAGPVRLLSRTLCAQLEEVYNLEVEGEHCYRVGEQGLLVHNASAPNQNIKEIPSQTSATTYRAEDCSDSDFFIFGTVGSGVLKFEVVRMLPGKTSSITGRKFFDAERKRCQEPIRREIRLIRFLTPFSTRVLTIGGEISLR